MKKAIVAAILGIVCFGANAQNHTVDNVKATIQNTNSAKWIKSQFEGKTFGIEHLDVSAGFGSTGFNFEGTVPVTDWLDLRAGIAFTPKIKTTMAFGIQIGETHDQTTFDKMRDYMKEMTGFNIDDAVDMNCRGRLVNAKVLFDIKPFTNKDWHFTAGFYWGTRKAGFAINSIEDMTTTLAVGMYNQMYDKVYNFEPIFAGVYLPLEYEEKFLSAGKMSMNVGTFTHDMTDNKGVEHKAGDKYLMVPDEEEGTVKAWARINSFKPYLGLGWSHAMKKCPDWRFGVDAGVLFWGGVPNVYTHDGVSLTKDLKDLHGKVGDVISSIKNYPVYPVLEFKISKRIF